MFFFVVVVVAVFTYTLLLMVFVFFFREPCVLIKFVLLFFLVVFRLHVLFL